jgi:hypothetical protein
MWFRAADGWLAMDGTLFSDDEFTVAHEHDVLFDAGAS